MPGIEIASRDTDTVKMDIIARKQSTSVIAILRNVNRNFRVRSECSIVDSTGMCSRRSGEEKGKISLINYLKLENSYEKF